MIQFISIHGCSVFVLFLVFAYLLGSVSSAIIVSKIVGLPNPTQAGSKNAGATNMLRLGGKKIAAVVLLGDLLKGLIVIILGKLFLSPLSAVFIAWAGVAVVLGHMFPVFFNFKGGKGVATGAGVLMGLAWHVGLLALLSWILIVALFRYSSLAAVFAAVVSPFLMAWIAPVYLNPIIVMNLLIIWRHQDNIVRLIKGTEMKVGYRGH